MVAKSQVNLQPAMQRTMQIVHEHLMHQRRNPRQLKEIASRLAITESAALSLAIADQLCEEFTLTPSTK